MKHGNYNTPITRFIFYVNKPKAKAIGLKFKAGCARKGYDCALVEDTAVVPGAVGVFYGVVPQTYGAFRYYMAEGRAIYLDNGWLSTSNRPTFRFSWNSAQPFLRDLKRSKNYDTIVGKPPKIKHRPVPKNALLILQSKQYNEFMRLPYSRDTWERATSKLLISKGYSVSRREKPNKRNPEALSFFEQLETAEIVVSMNSAASLRALRYGIPAFCTLDCTPSPLAPVRVPDAGRAAPPNKAAVEDMCRRIAEYEFTNEQLQSGTAVERMVAVPSDLRRGYWYSSE